MAVPQDDAKRPRTGGRYNFDASPSDDTPAEGRTPDPDPLKALAEVLRDELVMQQRHKPAPMRKREKAGEHGSDQKRPDGMGPIAVFGALIVLLSFGLAYDFASGGKIRQQLFAAAGQEIAARVEPAVKKDEPATAAPQPEKAAESAAPVVQQAASADASATPGLVAQPATPAVVPPAPAPAAQPEQQPVEAPSKPAEVASNDNAASNSAEPVPQAMPVAAQPEAAGTQDEPAATALPPPVKANDAEADAAPAQVAAGAISQGQVFP